MKNKLKTNSIYTHHRRVKMKMARIATTLAIGDAVKLAKAKSYLVQ